MVILFYILISITGFFLVFPFMTVLASFIKKEKRPGAKIRREYDFGCIITAYKNADISLPLITSLLKQNYGHFHIYLVADGCDLTSLDFEDERVTVLNPHPHLNLKVKSIIHATENFVRNHDYIAVFDADNLAHPDFLKEINLYANAGYIAIQGQRTAKNLDSVYSALDALGEFYKNYIERYLTYVLGSSSVISGSGMAVRGDIYKKYLTCPEIEKGKHLWKKMLQEDKILQNFLLKQDIRIAYSEHALCYDEKVTSAQAVETQRSRWLFSYFQNIPNAVGILRRGLFQGSWNQLYFGLVTLSPPLFILVMLSFFLATTGIFVSLPLALALFGAIFIFSANVLFSLYLSKAPKAVWKAIWSLPNFIFRQMTALARMGNPNKHFRHTEHNRRISIEEVLSQKL